MATPTVEVLGIRHHGPGSARAVGRALDQLMPSVVVIEGPPELDGLIGLASDPGLVPPVAGLVYDVAAPRYASFYPLARFSPEWVALQWALTNNAAVQFADLPAANRLALDHHGADGGEPAEPVEHAEDAESPASPELAEG